MYALYSAAVGRCPKNVFKNNKNMFSTISALEIARQHSKVSHDSNNSKSPDITIFGHFGVPKTTLNQRSAIALIGSKRVNIYVLCGIRPIYKILLYIVMGLFLLGLPTSAYVFFFLFTGV
jgi:hypothetical protein